MYDKILLFCTQKLRQQIISSEYRQNYRRCKSRVVIGIVVRQRERAVRSSDRFLHYFSMQMPVAIATHCKSNLNYFL